MKKLTLLVALAAIGICNANAQSSVTLYGRVAAGIDYVTNVATPTGQSNNNLRFGSNQYGYSWFGLKGDEDLGGGFMRSSNSKAFSLQERVRSRLTRSLPAMPM